MKIQVLGSGCPKCQKLEENVRKAVSILTLDAEIEKVTELDKIIKAGIMSTPVLVIDGIVKSAGRLLSPDQIKAIILSCPG